MSASSGMVQKKVIMDGDEALPSADRQRHPGGGERGARRDPGGRACRSEPSRADVGLGARGRASCAIESTCI